MTYSTHYIHLEPTDTLTVERNDTGLIVAATVSDTDGATVARVEFLARRTRDQLDPVALAAGVDAEPPPVICGRCGMPATADLCTAGVGKGRPLDDSDIMPGSEFDGPVVVR